MKLFVNLLLLQISHGFIIQQPTTFQHRSIATLQKSSPLKTQQSISTSRTRHIVSKSSSDDDVDDEIERLRSMAAKLRAEATTLEAQKAQELADAAEKAFRKFDVNSDGEISAKELKEGLEKALKVDLSDKRVSELMVEFDASGDGALQIDEFPTIDKFRNQLETLARNEKQIALDAAKEAKLAEEQALLAEAKLELINNKTPSNSDKLISVIPYLFPLMDGLQYGRFFLQNDDGSNPFVVALAVLYGLYRTIPFSGFVAFLALNILSGKLDINRLIRYNMQQAIFVDIALIFPGLLSGLLGVLGSVAGVSNPVPQGLGELGSDVVFVGLLLVLAYCAVSSLLGIEPNKLPLISDRVTRTMPTLDMFDDQGRFIPPQAQEQEDKDDKKEEK